MPKPFAFCRPEDRDGAIRFGQMITERMEDREAARRNCSRI